MYSYDNNRFHNYNNSCVAGIAFIIIRRLPQIKNFNVDTIKEEKRRECAIDFARTAELLVNSYKKKAS